MDSLTYYYNGKTNQLNYISDNIAATNYTTDIDNQSANNYAYDSIGNLTQVAADGVSDMQWTVYGKLKKAIGLGFSQEYIYDANNNRVIKIGQQGSITGKQYYIRDAQGNILASYSYDGTSLKWNEQDLYGSSRIGLWGWNKTIPARVMLPQSETDTLTNWYLLGSRYYELTNHLGNVLSVITDKKKGVSLDSATVDHYVAEVLSQNDYYPFGMLQPGRSFNGIPYPYAFNGKRMENVELSITNIYDYGMRSYDARIGRFYSVDPKADKYPSWSTYNFTFDNPINLTDPDGADPFPPSTFIDENGNVVGGTVNDNDLGVYRVSGLTRANFDVNKISLYKQQGTRVGRTLSLNSFLAPETNEWMGHVNFNNRAGGNVSQATKNFGNYLLSHTASEGFRYYKANAGNTGIYDIKSWNFKKITGKTWLQATNAERLNFVYQASFYDNNTIMTRRDQGNFFAGRAMKMTGTPESVWLSGFGAYQSNQNKTGFGFYLKSAINWLDQQFMHAATNGTPMQGLRIRPIYHDDKVSEDLQRAGYNQFQR